MYQKKSNPLASLGFSFNPFDPNPLPRRIICNRSPVPQLTFSLARVTGNVGRIACVKGYVSSAGFSGSIISCWIWGQESSGSKCLWPRINSIGVTVVFARSQSRTHRSTRR
ncbi:hypothetical protein BDP27DRAFT_540619 [Rhodocollybia butyracea]|uniref:Uncharacterized protein n=1 Tax=Rhodocollybia butyracea TaxID=206335 RepID=A0A9P5P5V5_9AGAR|nr:hypothetical protein BDP27DRAFT_540619 [Rhodocollybia butyracea]